MKVAFDTSVVVAASLEFHPHHERALIWLQAVAEKTIEGYLSRHTLAETWSVLTRLPTKPKLSGLEALRILERLVENGFIPIDLTGQIYDLALRRCADAGVSSGAVFDALHVVAAEAAGADLILTFNATHFRQVAGDGSPTILVPPEPPGLVGG